ncbi:hypothetical protein DQQ10_21430 [Pseudochryseolinea flava]|uniref:Uncharacterized protein n=1 Tax=Pseudochryseolinea flava TaxID=2059302 RepID=A0A364XWS4_9BACT|nr:hypothetical protein DQQ10_21430 [Pseudochryseolinea flava]
MTITTCIQAQTIKKYLLKNRENMVASDFQFHPDTFRILGFGAYHGSAKTYWAEYALLSSLTKQGRVKYYIPETNFAQAWFFNHYMEFGDTILLKDLVAQFQTIVGQEGTIDTYQHWKRIKNLNDELPPSGQFKVVGLDIINEYKYPIKLITHLLHRGDKIESVVLLKEILKADTSDYRRRPKSYIGTTLKSFLIDNQMHPKKYQSIVSDSLTYYHLLKNLDYVFNSNLRREEIIYRNYITLSPHYEFDSKNQFLKYGFSHILKAREGNSSSFFSKLIESGHCKRNEIITVMGYLTKSEVLWDKKYDQQKRYQGFTIEYGFGIGDYWKEYFKGIHHLKKTACADITLFKLNNMISPYRCRIDLIKVKMFMKKSNHRYWINKATTDFIDYAVLIKNSPAQIPIEELESDLTKTHHRQ